MWYVISENVCVAPCISYTITQTGRMRFYALLYFAGFDVNSMAHVYVMHVCKLYMACVSCLSAGRSQSVVIILYNDLRVDLWLYVKFITSCSSWIIEIRLVAWRPGVTNKMEFLEGHRSRSRPGRTSMKEPYYFTICVYLWLLCFFVSMHVRMVEWSLMNIKRIAITDVAPSHVKYV